MLGDVDRQQSARLWLGLRPAEARPITAWEVQRDLIVRPPRGTTHVVLDTPAGLHGTRFKEVMRLADKVLVPIQPSIFDIYATREFLDQLADLKSADAREIGLVGMRVDERTIAADQLHHFVQGMNLPVLAMLRPTQNYVYLAARGLTLFDIAPGRVQRDLEQWQGICRWLDATVA
jgi:chromosome partitioning protein